jgi:hypothetical protein
MNRSKSLTKILWVLGLLLVLFVGQTLAVDPYYRPANPVMDFVPQVIMNSDPYYDDVKDWSDGFPSIQDCKKCHTNDINLNPALYQIWGDLRSVHHKTQEAEMGQCNACHCSVVEPYSVSLPTTPASSITTPTPASCENCHFWDDPVNPTIHGIGEIKTWGPYGSGMHPDKLALGFDPDNLPSMGTHHEIGGNVYPKCWLCHPDEWHTSPYFPGAIRVCENCHSVNTLHSIQEHVTTNNIYTVNGVPNQTVTAEEKCNACHGDGITILPVCSCTLTPDNPPTPSVPRGGTLGFQATVTNNTDEVQVLKFATRITKPNGGKYPTSGYLKGPVTVRLDSHDSIAKHLSQYIPDTAPLGTYTYLGYVGRSGVIYHKCQFAFEVVE